MVNEGIREFEKLQKDFYAIKVRVNEELVKKVIDNIRIDEIFNENSYLQLPAVGSRTRNRKDHPEICEFQDSMALNEFYGKKLTEVVIEIECESDKYKDFDKDILKELNNYIDVVSAKLSELSNIRSFSKEQFRKSIIMEKKKGMNTI